NPWTRYRVERDWCADFSRPYDLFINCSSIPPCFCHARRGVAVVFFPEVGRDEFFGRHSPQWQERSAPVRMAYGAYQNLEWQRRCASYQLYVTLSEYSRRWLQSRWGVRSELVWPPLRSGLCPAGKENLLLSIGRFDTCEHKKPEPMILAFKALC